MKAGTRIGGGRDHDEGDEGGEEEDGWDMQGCKEGCKWI